MSPRSTETRPLAGGSLLLSRGEADAGGGQAWLLLHGFAGRATSWSAVLDALPASASGAALDLPGHGPGGARPGREAEFAPSALLGPAAEARFEAALDALVPAVEGCAAALGVARGSLGIAGYSLGARVALGLLVRHPGLFGRAVLISGTAGLEEARERADRAERDAAWAEAFWTAASLPDAGARASALEALFDRWEAQPVLARRRAVPAHRLEAHRAVRRTNAAAGLAHAMATLSLAAMPTRWPALSGLGPRLTLVTGAEDPKFSALAARMRARAPGAAHVVVAGAGHDLLLEAPEAVAAALATTGR